MHRTHLLVKVAQLAGQVNQSTTAATGDSIMTTTTTASSVPSIHNTHECDRMMIDLTIETKVDDGKPLQLLDDSPIFTSHQPLMRQEYTNELHDSQLQFELVMTQMQETLNQAANEWTDANQSTPSQPMDSTVGTSSSLSLEFITSVSSSLLQLDSAYRSSLTAMTQQMTQLRQQLESQSDQLIRTQLQLESSTSQTKNQYSDELSRIRIEEMTQRERETDALSRQLAANENKFLAEKLAADEEKAKWKARADEVAQKLELLSQSNSTALMEGEAKAIETGEGELKRIRILPSEHFSGNTSAEFHFRLAESQFLRMGGTGFHVTAVEYILNPPLLKRYHDFKQKLKDSGEPVNERLTFHGTVTCAMESIIKEGFRIGGVDAPTRHGASAGFGVYSSESPAVAMGYINDGRTSLLFSRCTPTQDSSILKDVNGVISQLVCRHRQQIIPVYVVHYAPGAVVRPRQ